MERLKASGIAFSVDDFGTGYSSLSYLKRLPLSEVKIDQGFIRDILTDPNDLAIAKMIMSLAEDLDTSVVAEGVETEKQFELLREIGCPYFQGYLFSQPMKSTDFRNFLHNSGAKERL